MSNDYFGVSLSDLISITSPAILCTFLLNFDHFRSNPYFAGPDNVNVQTMKEILLNFALYCPKMGYNQVARL